MAAIPVRCEAVAHFWTWPPLGPIASGAPVHAEPLTNFQQLDFEHERRVGWDHGRKAGGAVREVRRNRQSTQRTNLHSGDALIPSFDHAAGAQWKSEALVAIAGAVE